MDDEVGSFWIEEINGKVETTICKKRKYRKKKKEYIGWGSTSLIQFLKSIGRDTSNKITQSEVADIISEYVKQNSLHHPTKKKRIQCDERLHSLFGRKSIGRLKINDLLESHFKENLEESSDDILFDSEDDGNALVTCETPKTTSSERKSQPKKPVIEKPRSCFAAINPFNIKLVYLKRSLVEDLLKDHETFENKVVGSFIRIKCDPNDYLQKNSHQLLQVTGIKKSSRVDGEICLQASGFIKDISICMLSDNNFSEEECEDLHQRVKDGLLKRPMIVDMEQRARVLHEDMTKHWLARELALLENLIDRANEKGWRRELDEYLRKREKLQSPDEQERLLREIPQAIADDLESESKTPDVPDKKAENNLQELWQTTCTKASFVTEEVPKAVGDGFECKATKLYKELQSPDEQGRLLHEIPRFTIDNLESETTPPDIPDKKVDNNLKELWQTTCTKASLVTDVPKAVADGFACMARNLDIADLARQETNSPKSILSLSRASEVPLFNMAMNSTMLNHISCDAVAEHQQSGMPVQQQSEQQTDFVFKRDGMSKPTESNELRVCQGLSDKQVQPSQIQVIDLSEWPSQIPAIDLRVSQGLSDKQVQPSQIQVTELSERPSQIPVIELSDDDDEEETEKASTTKHVPAEQLESMMWHYRDPQGNVQGPFNLTLLKRWSDARYFAPDFKVWKSGQSQDEGVLLVDILPQFFPHGSNFI